MLQVSTSAKQPGVLAIIAAAASSHSAQPRSRVCVSHSSDVGSGVGGWLHVSTSATQFGVLAIIAAADALICPDSGPAHMGTAAGTPVIGLYATSNPGRSGPYLSSSLTVNAYPEAVGRFLRKTPEQLRWGQRVRDPGAMDLIRLRDVNAKIDQVFG